VTALINQHKAFPPSAIDREEEGQVLIAVTIAKDGHILESKIESPSPFESLNQAALDAILAVGKFPELPDPTPEPIHLHVPLIFKIER
jgi:TonB family protein